MKKRLRPAKWKFQTVFIGYLGGILLVGCLFSFLPQVLTSANALFVPPGRQKFMLRMAVDKSALRMAVTGYMVRMCVDKSPLRAFGRENSDFLSDTPGTSTTVHISPLKAKNALLTEKPLLPNPEILPQRPSGKLSALFESGLKGVRAIGYDIKGGTSYGKYQLSSRKGTMDMFIRFLEEKAPQWAQRLRNSGPANTKGVRGAMPREWKRIAAEDPKGFEALQDEFIHVMYYSPALEEVAAATGVDLESGPAVFREVLWSATVQHGPKGGARIFIKAAKRAGRCSALESHRVLLEEIFRERIYSIKGSSAAKRRALKNRLNREKALAITMLRDTQDKLALSSM